MCGRFGFVLGKPGMDENELSTVAMHYASSCDDWGVEIPEKPVSITPRVTTPDLDVLTGGKTSEAVTTCTKCVNCIPALTVGEEFGFPQDLCKAYGELILDPRSKALDCPYAASASGTVSGRLDNIELLPEFKVGFSLADYVIEAAMESMTADDPRTYVTDVPVSQADADRGVRAWRKITDPDGSGKSVFLPIFNPDFLKPEERALIPVAGSDEHPELYVDYDGRLYSFAVESRLDETFALVGPPGVGKTEFARWVAWLMQLPFHRFSFTNQSDPDDMIGTKEISEGRTYFQEARIPTAWRRPGVMVLDEPNTAPEAIWQTLRPLTDNSKQLVIDAAGGVIVPRHEFCFFLMGMNPSWEMKNIGTREMADADMRRLTPMYVTLPPPHIERHIVKSTVKALDGVDVSDADLDFIEKVAVDIREASEQGTYPGTWGIALQVKVARKLQWYTPMVAYRRSALDFYDPQTVELIMDAIKGYLPGSKRKSKVKEDPPF
jgi:MoxR-like ATPase